MRLPRCGCSVWQTTDERVINAAPICKNAILRMSQTWTRIEAILKAEARVAIDPHQR